MKPRTGRQTTRRAATLLLLATLVGRAPVAAQSGTGDCDGLDSLGHFNNAPLAVDDEAWTPPGQPVTIDVLANDVDFDGDPLTIDTVFAPASGTATVDGDTIVYEPGLAFEGIDSFAYVVSDGSCGIAQAGIRVMVSTNPPPPDEARPEPPVVTVPDLTG
ncbi:MAG TPA: hypothetical protein ENI86_15110 [Acidimicrobiales bacterium]|nr:hypothetical protein [Acidimicrobiales bacterium]